MHASTTIEAVTFGDDLDQFLANGLFGDHTAKAVNGFQKHLLAGTRSLTFDGGAIEKVDALYPFHQIPG